MGRTKSDNPKPKRDFMSRYKTYDTTEGYGTPEDWVKAFGFRMNLTSITDEIKEKYDDILAPLYKAKTVRELAKAYRLLIPQYHPDVKGDTQENKEKAQLIIERYFELKALLEKVK